MPGGQIVFLAVSFVLIAAWTGYNIWTVRRSLRLRRELEKLIREAEEAEGETPASVQPPEMS
jgi:hypothetical protein